MKSPSATTHSLTQADAIPDMALTSASVLYGLFLRPESKHTRHACCKTQTLAVYLDTEQGFHLTSLHLIILFIFHPSTVGSASSLTARGYESAISLSCKPAQEELNERKGSRAEPQLLLTVFAALLPSPGGSEENMNFMSGYGAFSSDFGTN